MPSFTRNGRRLTFAQRGSGPAVILQHALTLDGRSWESTSLPSRLEGAGFRVIMPEAAGHGGSDTPLAAAAGLDERCRDVIALADNFGIRRFHFAGYSMGGWIGTGLARSCPQRLLSLAIAGWDPIDGARHFTRLAGEEDRRREFEHLLNRLIVGKPSLVGAARREFYAVTYLRMFSDVPSLMWLATGLQPLMLAVGADDPYAMSVRHAADALGADFQVLPGDHLTAFGALELGTSILDWLRSQTSQFSMSTPATTRP